MTLQRDIFLQGEGRAWLERCRDKLGQHDLVSELIEAQGIKPKSVLEIGCANGWRLKKLNEKYGSWACGVDPGLTGRTFTNYGRIQQGSAEDLGDFCDNDFDVVIFGFCLYLCDPCDYFKIVAESDRVLADGGHLIVHDFDTSPAPTAAVRYPYEHRAGVWAHHFDFVRLWLSHPAYHLLRHTPLGGYDCATLLRKDLKGAFRDAQPLG